MIGCFCQICIVEELFRSLACAIENTLLVQAKNIIFILELFLHKFDPSESGFHSKLLQKEFNINFNSSHSDIIFSLAVTQIKCNTFVAVIQKSRDPLFQLLNSSIMFINCGHFERLISFRFQAIFVVIVGHFRQ